MRYEPKVCLTQKSKRERKSWLKNYLENVWDETKPKLEFDVYYVEYLHLGGRVTKRIKERKVV